LLFSDVDPSRAGSGAKEFDLVIARRHVLLAVGVSALAASLASFAQQPGKVARIGFLISETPADQKSRIDAVRAGLRDRGYVEGGNVIIDVRSADGNYDRLPDWRRNWRDSSAR
jgi:putative ABC transport system substrate-binding protein